MMSLYAAIVSMKSPELAVLDASDATPESARFRRVRRRRWRVYVVGEDQRRDSATRPTKHESGRASTSTFQNSLVTAVAWIPPLSRGVRAGKNVGGDRGEGAVLTGA